MLSRLITTLGLLAGLYPAAALAQEFWRTASAAKQIAKE
jgi:hypothetical protein